MLYIFRLIMPNALTFHSNKSWISSLSEDVFGITHVGNYSAKDSEQLCSVMAQGLYGGKQAVFPAPFLYALN